MNWDKSQAAQRKKNAIHVLSLKKKRIRKVVRRVRRLAEKNAVNGS